MKLNGNTALVTGAGRGIGREIALAFAREGAQVAITARSSQELESLAGEIAQLGGHCVVVAADLAQRGVVADVFDQVSRDFDHIDILVNNAGIGSSADPRPVIDFDDQFWELTLYLNLTVPYLLSKKILPGMIARHFGRIINVASINGKTGSFHGAAYAASKHGLLGLTRTLAMEMAQEGITVNAICPGPVKTRMNEKRVAYDAQRLNTSIKDLETMITPLGRRLMPEEIAPLAVYLASKEASVITGQAINIDGGLLMVG